ncbi:MAG: hypothetical protein N2738_04675, partial [Thermodesulfovibrionales bacterium]|nr:hypothetical protein [Thermodesulfovibrionales bacterium]
MELNNNISNPTPTSRTKVPLKRKKSNSLIWIVVSIVSIILVASAVYYFLIFKGDLFSTSIKSGQYQGTDNPTTNKDEGLLTAQIHIYRKSSINTKEFKIALNPVMIVMVESAIIEFLKSLPEDLTGI